MVLSWYILLLYIHIFSVVLSIGPYFVLFPLLAKIRTAPFEQLPDYLEPFRITVRLTKHAGHVLVATGIILTWITSWTWKTSWIIVTVLIMVASLYFIARAFSPLLRKLKAPHEDRNDLVNRLRKALIWYVLITLSMMWFMVAKPTLW
ncbi:DUF2269 domain-containing protein [Paenibacillus sp. HWE-109]|uniref:DUF2269 family protein n=1 Tax=Paenibacillus sp. HWE-109 TaxID=1306526 RepID=UPI001EE120F3|nr:DUF2269 family protein [Paenibacillus sp. HWE-109]UKS31065.1 DUF2269 domain-containing protein [Paenibacillus sp. HWE-109]